MTRKHLGKLLDRLFTDFTGVHFHVAWTPAAPWRRTPRTLPTGCSSYCRLVGARLSSWANCRSRCARHLAATLKSQRGHCFTCRLGLCNCWCPLRVRGETLGIVYLQALNPFATGPSAGNRSVRALQRRLRQAGARVMGRWEFARAVRFMRLIVEYLQTSSLADLQQAELGSVQRVLRVFENVQKRLRKKLNGVMPALRATPPVAQSESRPERLVHAVLDRIQRGYSEPLTLQKCAGELRVNAAYLSHLFSQTVGLSFKTCLTGVRAEKAEELLSDPANNISEVAKAVGYASANRFRLAFKKVTGFSPRLWRENLQKNPPPAKPSTS